MRSADATALGMFCRTTLPWYHPSRLERTLLFALLVVGSCPAVAQGSGTVLNLIPNPCFEEQTPGGVRAWKCRAWHGEQNGHWTLEHANRSVLTLDAVATP